MLAAILASGPPGSRPDQPPRSPYSDIKKPGDPTRIVQFPNDRAAQLTLKLRGTSSVHALVPLTPQTRINTPEYRHIPLTTGEQAVLAARMNDTYRALDTRSP